MSLVVMAGVQNLIHDGSIGFLGSSGIIFLFSVIHASSRLSSAICHVIQFFVTSSIIKWFSVHQLIG